PRPRLSLPHTHTNEQPSRRSHQQPLLLGPLRRWRAENHITGLCAVPYTAETRAGATTTYPLGRWIHQQRKALRAGLLENHRKKQLDDEGMVWEPGEEAWETKLRALATYRHAHGHLAPRQNAAWPPDGENTEPAGAICCPTEVSYTAPWRASQRRT
ncbi:MULTISPECIES: helicase associated domain-containing protein, partial [unclassified Streptomyces]|uniref:helicase associated domain-containing protein n=1 Tax=unclassified Streptomyces TaxID=2593676 RepID=UPI00380C9A22